MGWIVNLGVIDMGNIKAVSLLNKFPRRDIRFPKN
jgi:hypothetical protein